MIKNFLSTKMRNRQFPACRQAGFLPPKLNTKLVRPEGIATALGGVPPAVDFNFGGGKPHHAAVFCPRQDSNLEPLGSKPSTLSIELRGQETTARYYRATGLPADRQTQDRLHYTTRLC